MASTLELVLLYLVAAVLGVVAALALPAYASHRERVRIAQAVLDRPVRCPVWAAVAGWVWVAEAWAG